VNATPTPIIVWHGMGQQIRFETIELVARSLANAGAPGADCAPASGFGSDQKLWRSSSS
jgi:hypothetical protein